MSAIKAPPCAPSSTFWLELTGEQSLAGHHYCLHERNGDQVEVIPMEPCADRRGRMGPIIAGHLEASGKRSLVLELQGESKKVVIPVIESEEFGPQALKPPQREYQDNLMVSVHPTLFCDAGELTRNRPVSGFDEVIPAPMRTGWIYVFFRGRLWREGSVMTLEDGAPVMRDTDLVKVRESDSDRANDRVPVGPEIDVIHVPARLLGCDVWDEVQLAFSETQWSWHYVRALEEDQSLRNQRCRDARAVRAFLGRHPGHPGTDWCRLDDMSPMRSREHAIEHDHTCPGHWLCDVDGQEAGAAQQTLVAQRDAIESDDASVDADYFIETPSLFPSWRRAHLRGARLPDITEGTDAFESLRDRHLLTLHLRDPVQAARHLVGQVNASLALLLALVDNVKKRPFGVTAELFHNNFRRSVLPDGRDNPLYIDGGWFDNRLDDSEEGRLCRTMYDVERRAIREFVKEAQAAIVRMLENTQSESLTAVLRDLFALESGNAVAGFYQTVPILQVLSLPADRIDPLLLPQEVDEEAGQSAEMLALRIARGEHPVGAMLLPFDNYRQECQIGDATAETLRAMVAALEDRSQSLRVLEGNVIRELVDHQAQSRAPDTAAVLAATRSVSNAFTGIAGGVAQWWLGTIQKELQQKGATFSAEVSRIQGAFEGFAQAAIPGRTRVQLEGTEEGRAFVVLDVVDESGQTLTSGAAVGASLRLAEADAFDGTVKDQRVRHWLHQSTTSPVGLPGILVVFDLWNLGMAFGSLNAPNSRNVMGFLSAAADLGVSAAQLIALVPNQPRRLALEVSKWKTEARWFSSLAEQFGTNDRLANSVVRNHVEAGGWLAGMFTTALILSDAVTSFLHQRWGTGAAQVIQASGVATTTSADIIAARILTPAGRRAVERSSVKAVQAALGRLIPAAASWGGTVASGYVTALGFATYVLGEAACYRLKDDAVSQWLRAGPFSGDLKERDDAFENEGVAYIELIKAMTPVALRRIENERMSEWLNAHRLNAWEGYAQSVLTFASPALAITGEPADIELDIVFEQELYRILGPNPAGGWQTETLATRSGRIGRGIEERYDAVRQAIDFLIADTQLSDLRPRGRYERLTTRYRVERLSLTFTLNVWHRETQKYTTRRVTHTMEDLDVEWQK
ncbi:hypothetical protein [Marinobacter sp.]|uniref:hypothetical protein n=1 Tax=Marinobacter sp. TaxID=50741 RepID=UPI003567FCFE